MFKFLAYKFGQFLIRRISLKQAYQLANFLSDIHYFMSFRDRRAVRNNLRIITGSDENLNVKTREVFRNFGKYLVEFFGIANDLDENFLKDKVTIVNRQYLEQAQSCGKGVIMLTAHIGNWELGGLVMGMLGFPTLAITLSHKERPVNELFNKQRQLRGVVSVPIRQAVSRCLSALKENKFVGVLADRDFTSSGEKVPFLGREALIPKGAALFAYKTGATILPSFFLRQEDGRFSLEFEEPIYPVFLESDRIQQKDMITLIKQYAQVIEKKIRVYPTQWMVFREFWDEKATRLADMDERIT